MPISLDLLPPTARRVLIAVNPTAGAKSRRSVIEQLAASLAELQLLPEVVTSLEEIAIRSAALLQIGELRSVVAAGGDGTAAEVVNRTPPGTPVAVFPQGTENLLANYLEMSRKPADLAAVIAAGRTAWLDAGRAGGRLFLLMASAGFDAEVVRRLDAERAGNISRWTYAKPILETIRTYNYPALRVYCAQENTAGQLIWSEPIVCKWAFVFNIPRYAYGLQFAPTANTADGLLDLVTFQRGGLAAGLRYLSTVVLGLHPKLADHAAVRCSRLRIEADGPVHYETDGDPGGLLPLEIEAVPRRLRVLVSPAWSQAAAGKGVSSV